MTASALDGSLEHLGWAERELAGAHRAALALAQATTDAQQRHAQTQSEATKAFMSESPLAGGYLHAAAERADQLLAETHRALSVAISIEEHLTAARLQLLSSRTMLPDRGTIAETADLAASLERVEADLAGQHSQLDHVHDLAGRTRGNLLATLDAVETLRAYAAAGDSSHAAAYRLHHSVQEAGLFLARADENTHALDRVTDAAATAARHTRLDAHALIGTRLPSQPAYPPNGDPVPIGQILTNADFLAHLGPPPSSHPAQTHDPRGQGELMNTTDRDRSRPDRQQTADAEATHARTRLEEGRRQQEALRLSGYDSALTERTRPARPPAID